MGVSKYREQEHKESFVHIHLFSKTSGSDVYPSNSNLRLRRLRFFVSFLTFFFLFSLSNSINDEETEGKSLKESSTSAAATRKQGLQP